MPFIIKISLKAIREIIMTPPLLTNKLTHSESEQHGLQSNVSGIKTKIPGKESRMNTKNPRYAVCYIDKFADPIQSQWITSSMSRWLGLQTKHRLKLSSGEPVLIQSSLSILEASRLKQAIRKLGGSCWIQMLDDKGCVPERRNNDRRSGGERRSLARLSNSKDRRSRSDARLGQII